MFCGNCGQQVDDNAEFCSSCGARINGIEPNSNMPMQESMNRTSNATRLQQKKGRNKIPVIIGILLVAIVAVMGIYFYYQNNNEYVLAVKGGHPNSYPNITYEDAFGDFFASPSWSYFKGTKGEDVVEFTGRCMFYNKEVDAQLQFIVNLKRGTFETGAFTVNGVPQVKLMTNGLIDKVFSEYGKKKDGKGEITKTKKPFSA